MQVLDWASSPQTMDVITSTNSHGPLTLGQDQPDLLSTSLRKHDNDASHITAIKILPTYGEIASGICPYLPDADPASWHLSGVSGRFDRLFRLLREESIGQVRNACREVLQAVRCQGFEIYNSQRTSTHFHVCNDAKIHAIQIHKTDGLQFIIAMKQPQEVRNLTDRQRRDWWEDCNRFRSGTLVCALDPAGHILHFVVPNSAPRLPAGPEWHVHNFSLSGDSEEAYITLELVDSSQVRHVLRHRGTQGTHYFLDFPDMTLASFKYTLEALQYHYQSPIPHRLISALSPGTPIPQQSLPVAKPGYARAAGFTFNLDPLMRNRQRYRFAPLHDPTVSVSCALADLDPAQAKALLESLSREIALVGGLPESGKSYLARKIIEVLLFNRDTAGIGPILFIFHDVSALDRMVDQLLDDGIENIVRMGGPSLSERLQNLNLPVTSYTGMSAQDKEAEEVMKEFQDKLESDMMREFRQGRFYEFIRTNVEFEGIRSELRRYHDDSRRQILQDAHIVAATTAELSRYPELLQLIHAKVLLCDDAHELQESQILTAILPSTEHIILIGKDTIANERLQGMDVKGALDSSNASFFERLVNSPPYRGSRSSHLHGLAPIGESSQLCGRNLPDCSHFCQRSRHGDSECGPCAQPCDVRCSHSRCEKLCYEPCMLCTDDHCTSACPHSQCTMPCAAPCNWVPCSRRCTLALDCGHQCPSLCGEACPDRKYCQICSPEEGLLASPLPTSSGMKDYKDIDLDENPCIFPACGHFQTRSFMDWQLRIRDFYNLDNEGSPSGIKDILRPFSMQQVPCCIRCRSSLREIRRYGRIIRGAMVDEPLKTFLAWRNGKFSELVDRFAQCVPALDPHMAYRGLRSTSFHNQGQPVRLNGTMLNQMLILNDLVGGGRYQGLTLLFTNTNEFSYGQLKPREEVFQRVAGSMRRANENSIPNAPSSNTDRPQEPNFRLCGDMLGMDLFLRCNIIVLDDFLRIWNRDSAASTNVVSRPPVRLELSSNFRGCQLFIRQSQDAKQHVVAVQGHVYFAWYCGFALALGEDASTQGRRTDQTVVEDTEFPISQEELRRSAELHLAEARRLHNKSLHVSRRLKDAIEATIDFVRSSNQGSLRVPRTLWYTNVMGTFNRTGPWYVCDNGHAFMDVRRPSMFLGQLRCKDCGVIVADRQHAPEEEAPHDSAAAMPPQEVNLIDI